MGCVRWPIDRSAPLLLTALHALPPTLQVSTMKAAFVLCVVLALVAAPAASADGERKREGGVWLGLRCRDALRGYRGGRGGWAR